MNNPELSRISSLGEKPKTSLETPDLEMYEIPGQDPITEHALERYYKDKEQDQLIDKAIKNRPVSLQKKIKNKPSAQNTEILKSALKDANLKVQNITGDKTLIQFIPEEDRAVLVGMGLNHPNKKIQEFFAEMIDWVPNREKLALIKLALLSPNGQVKKFAISRINLMPEKDLPEVAGLLSEIIKKGFEKTESIVGKKKYAKMIRYLPSGDEPLRDLVFQEVQKIINGSIPASSQDLLELIQCCSKKQISYLFNSFFNSANMVEKKIAINIIPYLSSEEVRRFAKEAINDSSTEIQKEVPRMIQALPSLELNFLKKEIVDKFDEVFKNDTNEVQKEYATLSNLIATKLIRKDKKDERQQFVQEAINKGAGESLIESRIYHDFINKDVDQQTFARQKFSKKGLGESETTLIGGDLKYKTIIRHMTPESFKAWQNLYENFAVWRRAGFDYVPIEPIQSYRFNQEEGLVDVFSGVLDLSLDDWLHKTGMFEIELRAQKLRIIEVLSQLKIDHGHDHPGNFCLRFFRDSKGRVDFSRVPRLYLIDFDRSSLSRMR